MKYSKKSLDYYNYGVFTKGSVSAILLTHTKEEANKLAEGNPALEVRELIH